MFTVLHHGSRLVNLFVKIQDSKYLKKIMKENKHSMLTRFKNKRMKRKKLDKKLKKPKKNWKSFYWRMKK
jgi:hypothetical protein